MPKQNFFLKGGWERPQKTIESTYEKNRPKLGKICKQNTQHTREKHRSGPGLYIKHFLCFYRLMSFDIIKIFGQWPVPRDEHLHIKSMLSPQMSQLNKASRCQIRMKICRTTDRAFILNNQGQRVRTSHTNKLCVRVSHLKK